MYKFLTVTPDDGPQAILSTRLAAKTDGDPIHYLCLSIASQDNAHNGHFCDTAQAVQWLSEYQGLERGYAQKLWAKSTTSILNCPRALALVVMDNPRCAMNGKLKIIHNQSSAPEKENWIAHWRNATCPKDLADLGCSIIAREPGTKDEELFAREILRIWSYIYRPQQSRSKDLE